MIMVIFLSGCLELEQKIRITEQGGIEADFNYFIPVKTADFLQKIKPVMDEAQIGKMDLVRDDYSWILKQEELIDYFQRHDCKMINFKKEELGDGGIRVHFKVVASDYRKVLLSGVLGNFDLISSTKKQITIRPVFNTISQKINQTQKQKVKMVCQGLKLKLTIQVPTSIRRTDGLKNDQSASWTFDLDKDDYFLDKFPEMMITFDELL